MLQVLQTRRGSRLGVVLTLLIGVAIASFLYFLYSTTRVQTLTLAAGPLEGDSYVLSQAIAQVVNANHPNIRIQVMATCGSPQNLELLEQGTAQLATAQADVPAGRSARAIAVLYRDIFQLVVKRTAGIAHFSDLQGHTVALQADSAEKFSFLEVARHYGLSQETLQSVPCAQEVDDAFEQNQADAVFRVRSLGNDYIGRAIRQGEGQLVPITQGEAMRIKNPAFEPVVIPKGAYQGEPPIPDKNLPTVAVQRLLLASRGVDNRIVRQITQTLDEHRREIAYEILVEHADLRPLVAGIGRPNEAATTGVPLHRGALAYYERDKPTLLSFVIAHGDLLITLTSLSIGGLLWLRRNFLKRQDLAELYIRLVTQGLAEAAEPDPKVRQKGLRQQQSTVQQVFDEAAAALVDDRISQEAFRTFNEAYVTAGEVLERRLAEATTAVLDGYIEQLVQVCGDPGLDPVQRQLGLAQLLAQVEGSVTQKEISLEGFRTFLEAFRLKQQGL